MTYEGIIGPDGKMLAHWQEVMRWQIVQIYMFSPEQLTLTLHEKRSKLLHKVRSLGLPGLKDDERKRLLCTLERYFSRHTEMRIWQAERKTDAVIAQAQQA